jgi:tRNA A-37 threonylcarbamoyl transferase component Bud32
MPGHDDYDAAGLTDMVIVGRGATATVYRAWQETFHRTVAVKVFDDPLRDDASRHRFERECFAAGRLSSHPNVVSVFGNGFDSEGRPYIVMEYCGGGNVGALISSGAVSTDVVLRMGVKLASALHLAHQQGVLHRDIKPGNVLISDLDEPALADFGIAGALDALSTSTLGSLTPLHAAPEVLREGGGSVVSDVWSLASTLYTMLLGRAPFEGSDKGLLDLLLRVLNEPLPPLGRADVPASLETALGKAMAKDPAERTPTAAALATDLQVVQAEVGLPVTEFLSGRLVAPTSGAPPAELAMDAEPTRVRSSLLAPTDEGGDIEEPPPVAHGEGDGVPALIDAMPAEHTHVETDDALTDSTVRPPTTKLGRKRLLLAAAGLAVVTAAVVVPVITLSAGHAKSAHAAATPSASPTVPLQPTKVSSFFVGRVITVTWTNPPAGKQYRDVWVLRSVYAADFKTAVSTEKQEVANTGHYSYTAPVAGRLYCFKLAYPGKFGPQTFTDTPVCKAPPA